MNKVKCTRLYADSDGESHVEDVELELTETNFAPPAPSMWVSSRSPAAAYHLLAAPSGWYGDWHPAPMRQIFFLLRGEWDVESSDGAHTRWAAGAIEATAFTSGGEA